MRQLHLFSLRLISLVNGLPRGAPTRVTRRGLKLNPTAAKS
jgi:hypothetical protein